MKVIKEKIVIGEWNGAKTLIFHLPGLNGYSTIPNTMVYEVNSLIEAIEFKVF